jgi:hypothetical protein
MRVPWTAAAILLALPGCANPPGQPAAPERIAVVKLVASNDNAGEIGQATLVAHGGQTQVALTFSGVPSDISLPVHVYTYVVEGRCDAVPAVAAYALNDRVLPDAASGGPPTSTRGPFVLSHMADISFEELLGGRFALVLRSAPADRDRVLFCAELRQG